MLVTPKLEPTPVRLLRQIENCRQHNSGSLLDRIDIHVEVPPVTLHKQSSDAGGGESFAATLPYPSGSKLLPNLGGPSNEWSHGC